MSAEGEDLQVEMRTTTDGRTALLVYSALDRLLDCCGPHQPYAVVGTSALDEVGAGQPFDVVYFDMVLPDELRHTTSGKNGPGADLTDDDAVAPGSVSGR